jgi:F-type H+-transporting ATPase subunit b
MEIVPDPLLVAIFLPPFLVAVVGMWFILWKPLLDWMGERQDAVMDARSEARRLEGDIEARLDTLESKLAAARAEVTERRNAARAEAVAAEQAILTQARDAAEARIDEATARIAEESEVARRGLEDAARSIADDMATQVLGRPLQA